ncbi:hypothetical protein QVD17_06980 [Tagetes erecta]|uniref:Uncharacterized protein n=1 Tax=Tagetes erecta TaxID=13708 RepID=A0AAD8LLA2_TARER|nr:hypothetical protein QVD17_06980 [Tagetes erecta]
MPHLSPAPPPPSHLRPSVVATISDQNPSTGRICGGAEVKRERHTMVVVATCSDNGSGGGVTNGIERKMGGSGG